MLFTVWFWYIGKKGEGRFSARGHMASCVFAGVLTDLIVLGIVTNHFIACNIAGVSPRSWSWEFLGG